MAKLINIRINKNLNEIVFDWDNERHQAVKVEDFKPVSIEMALTKAASIIAIERIQKEI